MAGKLADLVELSGDPYEVDPRTVATAIRVLGTWVGGRRIDLDAFDAQVGARPVPPPGPRHRGPPPLLQLSRTSGIGRVAHP